MIKNMKRLVNSVTMGPLLYFIRYEITFLVGSDAMWNTMTVDKVFCKSMYGSSSRSIVYREETIIMRISLYFSKNAVLYFP